MTATKFTRFTTAVLAGVLVAALASPVSAYAFGKKRKANQDDQGICEDIYQCAKTATGNPGFTFTLVSRTPNFDSRRPATTQVWRDDTTGLLWGDTLQLAYAHYEAVTLVEPCTPIEAGNLAGARNCKPAAELACDSLDGRRTTFVAGRTHDFSLPTIEQWSDVMAHGAARVLPNIEAVFWTSGLPKTGGGFAMATNPTRGEILEWPTFLPSAVRCVGRPKAP